MTNIQNKEKKGENLQRIGNGAYATKYLTLQLWFITGICVLQFECKLRSIAIVNVLLSYIQTQGRESNLNLFFYFE